MHRVIKVLKRTVKASANNLKDDVNFKHKIEHALSCTLEKDGKDVSYGTIDESCLIKAARKEANCEWLDQALDRAVLSSTGRAVCSEGSDAVTITLKYRSKA